MAVFNNTATLTYGGNTVNSNTVTASITETLSVSKTALARSYGADCTIAYAVSLANGGTNAFENLTVTDNLGAYAFGEQTLYPLSYSPASVRYYINGVLQTAPSVTAGATLSFEGISVPAGGTSMLIYLAEVNGFAPLAADGTISNTVSVSGECIGTIDATETISADTSSRLSITKFVSPETVTECSEVTYTFIVQNTGNTAVTMADNVKITDVFDPALSNISASFNQTAWTENVNFSYNETSGLFETGDGEITVPAASYTQDAETGAYSVSPGVSTLVVSGTI